MTQKNSSQEEIKKNFIALLRDIYVERRSFLGYDIKIVSSASFKAGCRVSKEALYNFEKGENCLSTNQLLFLAKFYNVSLKSILDYINSSIYDKKVTKEIKKNNEGIKEKHVDELSNLVGFSGYTKKR